MRVCLRWLRDFALARASCRRARCKPRNLLGVCIGEELAYIRPKGVAELGEGRNLPDRVCRSVASDNKEKIKQVVGKYNKALRKINT